MVERHLGESLGMCTPRMAILTRDDIEWLMIFEADCLNNVCKANLGEEGSQGEKAKGRDGRCYRQRG